MKVDDKIMEIVKEQILKEFGNPDYYYEICYDNDGYSVQKKKIESISIEPNFSGGYDVRINGGYMALTDWRFDEEKAKQKVLEQNLKFWEEVKESSTKELESFDKRVAKQKAALTARLQFANSELDRLSKLKSQEDV